MACDLCHKADSMQGTMQAILKAHDEHESTDLFSQAEKGKPVMCSSCHADPAMGATENKDCKSSLSAAMHGFHAEKLGEADRELPKNVCHACHPGPKTKCLRDVMSQAGLTCTNCHGDMKEVGNPSRTPWVNMPSCMTCHTEALEDPVSARIKKPNEQSYGGCGGTLSTQQGSWRRRHLLRCLSRISPCGHAGRQGSRQRAGDPPSGA